MLSCIWIPTYVWMPPICSDTPDNLHVFKHPPYVPNASLHICMFWGVSACDWGMWGLSFCLETPHVFGCLPMCPTPSHNYMLPCMSVCSRGHCMYWGETSHMLGAGGTLAHLSGFWCLSVHPLDVCYASSCTFLVAHYVSSLYFHCYDYYSSSDCVVLWYVISIISDYGTLFDGASYNTGSAWCGSAATPDSKRLWRCSWPCLCATAATPIFDASSGLFQLCHGFSTGRFLFQH